MSIEVVVIIGIVLLLTITMIGILAFEYWFKTGKKLLDFSEDDLFEVAEKPAIPEEPKKVKFDTLSKQHKHYIITKMLIDQLNSCKNYFEIKHYAINKFTNDNNTAIDKNKFAIRASNVDDSTMRKGYRKFYGDYDTHRIMFVIRKSKSTAEGASLYFTVISEPTQKWYMIAKSRKTKYGNTSS